MIHNDAVAAIEERRAALESEVNRLQDRVEFVESLYKPIEVQRDELQGQVLAARAAVLRARHLQGAPIPTRWAGRLDERMLQARGLSEKDIALLQRGSRPNVHDILQDVSMLGDPGFKPYDPTTGALRWEARGGALKLSLRDVKERFGGDVALAVVHTARELDQHDASRRMGLELPWHPVEDRELSPAEVIEFLGSEVAAAGSSCDCESTLNSEMGTTTDVACTSDVPTPRDQRTGAGTSVKAEDVPRKESKDPSDETRDYPWSLSDEDVRALLEKPPLRSSALNPSATDIEDSEVDMEIRRLLDLTYDGDEASASCSSGHSSP